MASGESGTRSMDRAGSAKKINSDTPNNRRAGTSAMGSAAAIKKENPEKERERSLSQTKDLLRGHQAAAAAASPAARQRTPRSVPRTGPAASAADRQATESLRQRLTFETDSDATTTATADQIQSQWQDELLLVAAEAGASRRRSAGGAGGAARAAAAATNGRASSGGSSVTDEQDRNQVVGRLMHVRNYLKQAMARADQLRSTATDTPRSREELTKVLRLVQHLKDEEDDYMNVLQRMLAVNQQNGSDEGLLDTSGDSKEEMSDAISIDAVDMRSDISEATTGAATAEKEAELRALQQHRDLLRQMLEQQKQLKQLHEKQARLLELQRKAESRLLLEQEARRRRPEPPSADAAGDDRDDPEPSDGGREEEEAADDGGDEDEKERDEDVDEAEDDDDDGVDDDGGDFSDQGRADEDGLSAAVPQELRELRQRLSYLRNVFGAVAQAPASPPSVSQQQSAAAAAAGHAQARATADLGAAAAPPTSARKSDSSVAASVGATSGDRERAASEEERRELERKLRELEEKKESMDALLSELQLLRSQRHLLGIGGPGSGGAAPSEDGDSSVATTSSIVRMSHSAEVAASADGTLGRARTVLEVLEQESQMRKLEEMRDRLKQLKDLMQHLQQGRQLIHGPGEGEDDDDPAAEDDEAASDAGSKEEDMSLLGNLGRREEAATAAAAARSSPGRATTASMPTDRMRQQQQLASAPPAAAQVASAPAAADRGRGSSSKPMPTVAATAAQPQRQQQQREDEEDAASTMSSALGSEYRDDPEIQDKVRKLRAAKEKLARLQQLVKFAQDRALDSSVLSSSELFELAASGLGDDSASQASSLAASTAASTATTTSSTAAAAFAEKYRQSVAEAQEREELEKLYEARLAEQKHELDALAAERSRLLSIQQQLLELQRAQNGSVAAGDGRTQDARLGSKQEAAGRSSQLAADGCRADTKKSPADSACAADGKPLRRKVARSPGKVKGTVSAAQARQELAKAAAGTVVVTSGTTSTTRKQEVSFKLQHSPPVPSKAAAAEPAQSSGIGTISHDDLYDRIRAQRMLREELRQRSSALQRLLGTAAASNGGAQKSLRNYWSLPADAGACDTWSENMGASVASAGDLTTLATWGGSTFDESANGGADDDGGSDDVAGDANTGSSSSSSSSSDDEEAGGASKTGATGPSPANDDDGYPSDGIVQVEEEEEEGDEGGSGDSDNQTYTIDEDDYQYRQRYPADLAAPASSAGASGSKGGSTRKSALRTSGTYASEAPNTDAGGSRSRIKGRQRRLGLQSLQQKLDHVTDVCELLLLDQRRTASLVQDRMLTSDAAVPALSTSSSSAPLASSLWSSCTVPGGTTTVTLPQRDSFASERAQLSQTVYALTQCFSQLQEQRVMTSELAEQVASLTSLVLRHRPQLQRDGDLTLLPSGRGDASAASKDVSAEDDDEKTLTPPQTDDRLVAQRCSAAPATAGGGGSLQSAARSLRECYQSLIESKASAATDQGPASTDVPPLKLEQLRRSERGSGGGAASSTAAAQQKQPLPRQSGSKATAGSRERRADLDAGDSAAAAYRPGLSAGISGMAFSDTGSVCSSAISSVRAANCGTTSAVQPSAASAAGARATRAAQIVSDLDSEADTPSEFSLFEALRESIYSEVATLISQNENRPHFLIEMFRELQMLTTDYLRQRALYAVQDLVTRFLTEDKVGDDAPLPAWMLYREDNSEQTPSESVVSTEDEDQLRGLRAPGDQQQQQLLLPPRQPDVKLPAGRRMRGKRAAGGGSVASLTGSEASTKGVTSSRNGNGCSSTASVTRFDYVEKAETGSSLSTPPSQYGAWDSYFADDSLEGTVIHLEKAMAQVREYEKQQEQQKQRQQEEEEDRGGSSAGHSGPDSNGRIAGTAKELSGGGRRVAGAQALPADQASDCSTDAAQTYTRVDTRQLDRQIKGIMAELIPVLKEHMEDVCSQPLLTYLRGRVLSLVRLPPAATEQGQEFVRFFHRQLGSILQDSLSKFEGNKMRECGEDLLVDVSEILFNELAFFRLMQDLDEPHVTGGRWPHPSQGKAHTTGAAESCEPASSEQQEDDDVTEDSEKRNGGRGGDAQPNALSSSAESVDGSSSSTSDDDTDAAGNGRQVNGGGSYVEEEDGEGNEAGSTGSHEEAEEEENLGKDRDDEMASATDVNVVSHVMTAGPGGPPACYTYTGVMSPDVATFELSRSEFKSVARMGSDYEEDEAEDDSNDTADDDSTSDTAVARQAARDGSSIQSDACASYPDDFEEAEPSSDGGGDVGSAGQNGEDLMIGDLPPKLNVINANLAARVTKEQEGLSKAAALATAELFDDGDMLVGSGDLLPEPASGKQQAAVLVQAAVVGSDGDGVRNGIVDGASAAIACDAGVNGNVGCPDKSTDLDSAVAAGSSAAREESTV